MTDPGWFLLAIAFSYVSAVAALLVRLWFPGRFGTIVGWCGVPVLLLCPMLIPSASLGLRAAAAFVSGDIGLKIVDLFRHVANGERSLCLRDCVQFLIPFPTLAVVYPDHIRRLTRRENPGRQIRRVLGGVLGVSVALSVLWATHRFAVVRSSFPLDHAVMLLTFMLAVESISRAACGLERLAGFDTEPIIRNAYRSRTIAEFWRRYNYRVHDWLDRNVFRVSGGRRAPVRSIVLVFLVSGIFHELMFAVATSRLTGYQFAFFMIQCPAVLGSRHLERLARQGGMAGKIIAHGTTILFLAVTSVLFFEGVSQIFPFIYASQSPLPAGALFPFTAGDGP